MDEKIIARRSYRYDKLDIVDQDSSLQAMVIEKYNQLRKATSWRRNFTEFEDLIKLIDSQAIVT